MDTATVHISTIERKSRMRKWTIIALIALMTSPLYAETITLDEALQAAQATNTDIEVARIQLEGELREAGFSSSLIPDISLVGGYSWSNASILDQNTGTGAGTLSLGIEWDIGSSLITEAKVKDLQGQVAALDFLNASQTVEEAVVAAYWAVASAQDQVESATLALEAAQESLELVTSRYESGLVDKIELSQAKLEVLEYQSTLVTAENAYQSACIAFSLLTGLGSDGFETEEIEELGTFTSQGLESLLSAATSGNTSLQSLRKEVDLAQANSLDTMADYQLPRVQLSANYSLGGSGVAHHLYYLCQSGIRTHIDSLALYKTGLIHCSGGNKIPGGLVHRNTLAGEGRLVDGALPVNHPAVHGNTFTGTHRENISFKHLGNGDFNFRPGAYNRCGLGGQLYKIFQGVSCFPLGHGFQQFSHCY